jgi:uncharacterized protein (DUF1778 family)
MRLVSWLDFREEAVLLLSDHDRDRFLNLLNNPPPPSPALKRAKEAHSRLIRESR